MLYKIIFMGTPDLAAECLKALASVSRPFSPKSSWEIIAVLSQPDKPKGRKLRLQPTPAKNIALQFGIPCFQPEKLRTPETLELLQKLAPDLIIVAAYGKILLKILKAEPLSLTENQNDNYLKNSSNTPSAPPPGTILRAENDELWIACGEGILRILELQREGKKPLPTRQLISGTSLTIGTQLE